MNNYHKYIYDTENRIIIGDFEGAYKECPDVWPTQHNMAAPHFSYIRGLLSKICSDKNSHLTILDIGCGYGTFVNDLVNFKMGKVIGYDISPSAISKGKEYFGNNIDLRVGALSDIYLPSKSCDIILLLGVLWFLLDDLDNSFKKIQNMLHDDGEFILTLNVPNTPIGEEIIGSYYDLTQLVSRYFTIVDALHWYQEKTIQDHSFSLDSCDMLLRCKKQ